MKLRAINGVKTGSPSAFLSCFKRSVRTWLSSDSPVYKTLNVLTTTSLAAMPVNRLTLIFQSKPNVLSFELQESVTPTGSWLYTEWILNNKIIAKATSDGVSDADGTGDTWKVPFSQLSSGGTFLVRATSGSLVFTKWEYVAPLNWGD